MDHNSADFADPASDDPVKRASSRVQWGAVFEAQTSIDPQVIERWLGPDVWLEIIYWAVGEGTVECSKASYEKNRELIPSSMNEASATESSLLFYSRSDWFRRWLKTL